MRNGGGQSAAAIGREANRVVSVRMTAVLMGESPGTGRLTGGKNDQTEDSQEVEHDYSALNHSANQNSGRMIGAE